VALISLGGWQMRNVPLDAVPEFSPLMIEVKAEALGLSSSEVESLITVPLEADLLNGVPFLRRIQSESGPGVSSIELYFEPGTQLMRARQMVQERLTQAGALPQVSVPPVMLQPVSSTSRIMNIGLSSNSVSLIDMTVQAHWTIVPRLVGVPGVANVSIWGRRDRQVHVEVDPERLNFRGVTLEQIVKSAGEAVFSSPLTYLNSSTPGTGGFIDTPNQRLNIRHVSPINSPEQFARIAVYETNLQLGSVARVSEGRQPLIGDALIGDGSGILLVVEKFPGYNTQAVTRAVERAMAELKPGLGGITIDTSIYRPAGYIERATGNITWIVALAGAAGLVALLLLAGWRAMLVASIAVPLSLLAAALVLHLRGVNFDMLVLAGLLMAIGAIVHDAVLDADSMARRLRQARAAMASEKGARVGYVATLAAGATQARSAMLFATLIALIAVAPALFLEDPSRAFFLPLVLSYAIAVLASLLVALTVTPALAVLLLRHASAAEPRGPGLGVLLTGVGERLLRPFTRSIVPAVVLAGVGALAVAGTWTQASRELLPSFRETDIVIDWQGPPGTSLAAMNRVTHAMMKDLRAVPGVRSAAAQVGRAVLCNCADASDVNSSNVWVSIDPAADYLVALDGIRQVIAGYPGMRGDVETYLTRKMREALTGDEDRLTVRVYGQDLKILRAKAEEIERLIAGIPGIANARIEEQVEQPSIEVEVNLDRAAQHGLKPGDMRRATSTLVSGITVGALFEEQKVFDVVVWAPAGARQNVDNVRNLMLDVEGGRQVRLADVADVRIASAPSVIHRQGSSRRLDIEIDVSGRSVSSVARDVSARVANVTFPFEYHAQVLGEHHERRAALRAIDSYMVAAGVLIFLLLQAALSSWRLAALSALGVPVVLLGVALGVLLSGGTVMLGTLFGAAAALVLAVRAGIMLVRHLQLLEHEGTPFGDALVHRALHEVGPATLAAHLIVAAITLPFVIAGSVAGLEILHPMAVALLGGTIFSLLAIMLLVPAFYLRFGQGTAAHTLGLEAQPA
jgi:Cu/Ag efflux pump CusA